MENFELYDNVVGVYEFSEVEEIHKLKKEIEEAAVLHYMSDKGLDVVDAKSMITKFDDDKEPRETDLSYGIPYIEADLVPEQFLNIYL